MIPFVTFAAPFDGVIHLKRAVLSAVPIALCLAAQLGAQSPPPVPVSRFTNEGVLRADSAVDAVFQSRTRLVDTVDIGDFASHLLARLGVPPFEEPMGFEVTADSLVARISGRLSDFPAESRTELGPIFFFVDSTTMFTAEVALIDRSQGVMRFRLHRVLVGGFPIPELLLLPALREYDRRYPILSNGGRDLLIAMPPEATVKLVGNGIELRMP